MPIVSAGLLMYRSREGFVEVFLVHPGGPFWTGKDAGAWSIPKGLIDADEEPMAAAKREFEEETGFKVSGDFTELSSVRLKSGKVLLAWAVEGDCDPSRIRSNTFLENAIVGPFLAGLNGPVSRVITGYENHGQFWPVPAKRLDHIEAAGAVLA